MADAATVDQARLRQVVIDRSVSYPGVPELSRQERLDPRGNRRLTTGVSETPSLLGRAS